MVFACWLTPSAPCVQVRKAVTIQAKRHLQILQEVNVPLPTPEQLVRPVAICFCRLTL